MTAHSPLPVLMLSAVIQAWVWLPHLERELILVSLLQPAATRAAVPVTPVTWHRAMLLQCNSWLEWVCSGKPWRKVKWGRVMDCRDGKILGQQPQREMRCDNDGVS